LRCERRDDAHVIRRRVRALITAGTATFGGSADV
jgi:hypothetical protein